MFAVLGDIEFELITYWDGFEATFGVDYAEHARIEGKPGLQFVGDKLDEIQISLVFHQHYCVPDVELARLRTAMKAHQALALVFGNGDYRGWFVITDVTATSEQTDSTGNVLAVNATASLREYIGDPKNPLSGPWLITTARHAFDRNSGYITELEVARGPVTQGKAKKGKKTGKTQTLTVYKPDGSTSTVIKEKK